MVQGCTKSYTNSYTNVDGRNPPTIALFTLAIVTYSYQYYNPITIIPLVTIVLFHSYQSTSQLLQDAAGCCRMPCLSTKSGPVPLPPGRPTTPPSSSPSPAPGGASNNPQLPGLSKIHGKHSLRCRNEFTR